MVYAQKQTDELLSYAAEYIYKNLTLLIGLPIQCCNDLGCVYEHQGSHFEHLLWAQKSIVSINYPTEHC